MTMRRSILDVLKSDRALNWIGIGTACVVLLIAMTIIAYGPGLRSNTQAIAMGTDLAGCRSQYSSEVTQARTNFDQAEGNRNRTSAEHTLIQTEITRQALFGDEGALTPLLNQLDDSAARVRERNALVVEAQVAYDEANLRYQAAVSLSLTNPEQFLADCRKESP
jgi:hypothetical protein